MKTIRTKLTVTIEHDENLDPQELIDELADIVEKNIKPGESMFDVEIEEK